MPEKQLHWLFLQELQTSSLEPSPEYNVQPLSCPAAAIPPNAHQEIIHFREEHNSHEYLYSHNHLKDILQTL